MSVPMVEIPATLFDDLLLQVRIARLLIEPGVSEHHGTDVADLAEGWAERLFRVKGGESADLTPADLDELTTVVREGAEANAVLSEFDPGFVGDVEAILRFLREGQ